MSRREEFVGVRVIEIADYDGNGNNRYAMWLNSKEPIVRCRYCKHYKIGTGHQCNRFAIGYWDSEQEADVVIAPYIEPDGFCKWGVKLDE